MLLPKTIALTSTQLSSNGFLRQFSRLAIANIVSNLMVPLAGIIDTAFLGHLPEIRYLAGVALATVIFNVVYWSFGFLRMGTTGLTAQAQGRQDRTEMLLILLRNGLLALLLGSLIVVLQVPVRSLGFGILNATPDVRLAGEAFYNARIWGAPATLLNYVLLGWFLGQGQGRRVVILSLIANGGNILLDYWFIQRLGWASAGAGAATALSQGLMLLVGLAYVGQSVRFGELFLLRTLLLKSTALGTIVRLNRDILIRTFALVLSFALFTNWSSALGTEILAVNTLLLQVVTMTAYFVDGIAFATESFAGQFYGAGQPNQLRRLLRWAGGASLALGLLFSGAFVLVPRSLLGLMTDHDPVLTLASQYVGWLVPTLGLGGIAFMLDGYFLGLTAGKALRTSTLIATLCGFLPAAALARWLQVPHLLWLALMLFMGLRAATLAWVVPQTFQSARQP